MKKRDDMTFPIAEYERRLKELRDRMARRLLDAVIISDPENLFYLTDYQTTGYSFFQALVVPLDDEPFMITREMEESNIFARTWVELSRPYSDTGDAIQMLIQSLREFGLADKVIGYERNSYFLPAYQQDRFRTSFNTGRMMDCFGIVEQGRVRKSPVEIEVMYKAAVATEAGIRAGFEACEAGVTENDVAAAISAAMFRAGGEFPAVMPYVTSGPRSMIGHATWEGRVIQPGDHVFLEVGGCFRRYHTAMMRTVVLGEPSPSMVNAQERMKHALDEVRAAIRPGLTVSDADNIVRNIISENEVGARLITRSGYSIGIAFPPSWDEGYIISLKQGDASVLEEGMTFHIIPWMWGVDGDKTVGISDTIHVTADGCQSFFNLDPDFVYKGVHGSPAIGEADFPVDHPNMPYELSIRRDRQALRILKAVNPATGKVLRETPALDPEGVRRVIAASGGAFAEWKGYPFKKRARVLKGVAALMREEVESLAPLMTEEMGKPIKEARAEVLKAAWCAEHYADHAAGYLADEEVKSDATRSYIQYLPLGPVLGILPWNAPFWLAFRFCAPALMAGNTCVMKHDPNVPACAQAIAELFTRVEGAPANIMQNIPVVTGDVEEAIRHPLIRAVSFTGSERAGSIVASIAASEIKPAVLELGGSDPCVVLEDADLEQAADVITLSRIINAGQSCIAAKRIIAVEAVHDKLVDLLYKRLAALKVGDPASEETDIGPIARADLRDNLHRQVSVSVASGATCRFGGQIPEGPGFFYPVTLLTDVSPNMTAACEETFGPVAVVLKVKDEQEALQLANDTPYGLAASVWTSARRGDKMARHFEAGQVAVNGIVKTDPRLPSGGIKRSGYGRELGRNGIHEFVNAQQVWVGPRKE